MTRQAIQLGWFPRLHIKQTTAESYGQIYIGTINWLLMIVTVGLAIAFKSSENLAAAYGIAVSLTMLMTSGLLFMAMRQIWGWNLLASTLVAISFLLIDSSFLIANLVKVMEGGYIPLMLAAVVCGVMIIWNRGVKATSRAINEKVMDVDEFFKKINRLKIPRVPGTAVFLTRSQNGVPPVMRWHVARNRALQQQVISLTIEVQNIPYVDAGKRLVLTERAPGYLQGVAHYGFMEQPHIPQLLHGVPGLAVPFVPEEITWYLGHETIIALEGHGMVAWQRNCFAFMVRNSTHITNYYRLPGDQVVEIGRRVAI